MANNIAVQTELTMLKVAILAAAWKEGEKDPAWVKRASDGKFSKNGGGASTANPEEEKGESTKERLRSLSDKAKDKAGELGDKAKSKASELGDKAKDTGADIGNSISKTLEKMGLKEEKALSPETSDLVGKLLKPDSLSTPEKRDEIADDIEDIYDDLMEGWENSPPEAKMALGGLLAVASFVAMHSAMKPLAKVAEGAMQVEKNSKQLNRFRTMRSNMDKTLMKTYDADNFEQFYLKKHEQLANANKGGDAAKKAMNAARSKDFSDISRLERESKKAAESMASAQEKVDEVKKNISQRVKDNVDVETGVKSRDEVKSWKSDNFDYTQPLDSMVTEVNWLEDSIARHKYQIEETNKSLQDIRSRMYREAEKAAAKPGATQSDKDFLKDLDQKIARMSKEAKEASFGDEASTIGIYKSMESYMNNSLEGADKMMKALPNAAGAMAGAMVGAEYSMKAIESAYSQISKQEKS